MRERINIHWIKVSLGKSIIESWINMTFVSQFFANLIKMVSVLQIS
jgi:hypothetical protein